MKLRITPRFTVTFLALVFVLHEAHEIAHTVTGRLICGCWGQRDFNVWGVCEGCAEQKPFVVLATFAGPLFTFLMIWFGAFLIKSDKTAKQKALGFSLIFANLPFARILGTALGSGDEVWGFNSILDNKPLSWIFGFLLVLLLSIYPLWKAFKLIENRKKIAWFLLFLLAPILIDVLVVLVGMNTLVERGILADYWILGSPKLVTVWTIFVTALYLLTRKNIYELSPSAD
ncbi:hypothetical protein DYBT9623_00184 [Dyadobacter sp. CECT 9623]|uniref:DUF2085 domain-containing protein n=1 Tax=Dyadobacter linearis TaxID=2823330 RepID=A0ABM8UJA6_9BACT|nr:hypothetical protein [Dyadobacter sp. CECT 9623]CAG5067463.1 hypothetical protein DYBT9623_00184 [Dyadobacter sp. CECT 9623]